MKLIESNLCGIIIYSYLVTFMLEYRNQSD